MNVQDALAEFGIRAELAGVTEGPQVIRYALKLAPGTRVAAFKGLTEDVQRALGVDSVRLLSQIPGTSYVGVEVPRAERQVIPLSEVAVHDRYGVTLGVGVDVDGNTVLMDLADLPHLLVAGTTNSGKSSFLNCALCQLVKRKDVALFLIDPKRVEFAPYRERAHSVSTDVFEATAALRQVTRLMDQRYERLEAAGYRNISEYNAAQIARTEPIWPRLVVVVDELADLMMDAKKVIEPLLVRLAQLGRAAGVHLILATQRPEAKVLTGLIRANVPSRLVFTVANHTDSGVALDRTGAQNLTGRGDALFRPVGSREPVRLQVAWASDADVREAVRQ
ncbi:DNA translocase FtsK [Tsukamurella soli]|uniref:DNA translocase FtsK n=1 Tax=Tsukamurella soli TaxID=644556 RepID=UPI0031F0B3C7